MTALGAYHPKPGGDAEGAFDFEYRQDNRIIFQQKLATVGRAVTQFAFDSSALAVAASSQHGVWSRR